MSRGASLHEEVPVTPGVLAWSPQRGLIVSPQDLADAVREGEAVLRATYDHAVPVPDDAGAPLVAIVRIDNEVAALLRQLTKLALDVDDLRIRLIEIAEAAAGSLSAS